MLPQPGRLIDGLHGYVISQAKLAAVHVGYKRTMPSAGDVEHNATVFNGVQDAMKKQQSPFAESELKPTPVEFNFGQWIWGQSCTSYDIYTSSEAHAITVALQLHPTPIATVTTMRVAWQLCKH